MVRDWATLYTDYSGKGGFGIWAISKDYGEIIGAFRTDIKASTQGELFAIVRGVEVIREYWPDVNAIKIYSDSLNAVSIATWNAKKPKNQALKELQKSLRDQLNGVFVRTNWIAGHQNPNRSKKAYFNYQCDLLSRSLCRG